MGKHSGEMIVNKKGFVNIDLPNSIREVNSWMYFDKGEVRRKLEDIFVDNIHYSLLRVFANPLAITKREDNKGNNLVLDYNLKKEYISVLNQLGKKFIGKSSFISFGGVEEDNIRGWPIPESVNFPVNYIIKEVHSKVFKDLVNHLNDEEAYEIIKKMEHPWNSNLSRINTLRKININPLVLDKAEFIMSSENIKNAINFFIPFRLKYEHDSHHSEDD
jgi:hypothetical protein